MDAIEALKLTNRLHARIIARRSQVQRGEDYYLGKQPLTFATREWKKANAARYSGFADNWCRPVVDAMAERIRHTGMKMDDAALQRELWGWWQSNDMEAQSSQGFLSTFTSARSYVSVWWGDDGEPSMQWEHAANVDVEYEWGNLRRRKAALKTWMDDDYEYAILYTKSQLWKWQRRRSEDTVSGRSQAQEARDGFVAGSWMPRESVNETWPAENPLGAVPIVEIPNRPMLFGDPVSELAPVMPMQDAANLMWAYMFHSADYASMPSRVVMRQGPPKIPIVDAAGNKVGEKVVDIKDLQEKRMLFLTGQNVAIDSWEAAKLDVFMEVVETIVGHIAAQTRTPPTYLVTRTGMSNVSAEGLKASEIGLVKKAVEFQTFASPAIREVYRLAALVAGQPAIQEALRVAKCGWANPEIRSESQLADALLKKKSIGYPLEYILELDGLEPNEITRVLEMARQEAYDPMVMHAARALDGMVTDAGIDTAAAAALGGDQ